MAVPYYVTLAPIAIAQGAVPLNAAEIQHAQDVLAYCARRRSNLLDQRNLLEYILDKSPDYEMDANSKKEIQEAVSNIQHDLDLLAACASVALNNRAAAKMPSDFAKDKGDTFGLGQLPLTLPSPKVAEKVKVPDFKNCTSWTECEKLADTCGLAPASVREISTNGQFRFKVVDVNPPAGVEVRAGSTIRITCTATLGDLRLNAGRLSRDVLERPWRYQQLAEAVRASRKP